ncbi:hypothetical protein B0H11DRAFT_1906021 [Mycena galericulata]|nr:hypothetical protein B0H11DRAFT_1906021 [Mycena galericulata]
MDGEPSLAAVALSRLPHGDQVNVNKYLALANYKPTAPPPRRLRRQLPRSRPTVDDRHSLATVALGSLSQGNRARVINYLALADHAPIPPPPKRCLRPAATSSSASRRMAPNVAQSDTAPSRRRGSHEVLLYCFFKDRKPPRQVWVPENNITANFVSLEGVDLRLANGAILEIFQKRGGGIWTAIPCDVKIPRRRGVNALFLRQAGIDLIENWHQYTNVLRPVLRILVYEKKKIGRVPTDGRKNPNLSNCLVGTQDVLSLLCELLCYYKRQWYSLVSYSLEKKAAVGSINDGTICADELVLRLVFLGERRDTGSNSLEKGETFVKPDYHLFMAIDGNFRLQRKGGAPSRDLPFGPVMTCDPDMPDLMDVSDSDSDEMPDLAAPEKINFILGAQSRTKMKVGVFESVCPGNVCPQMQSDIWPEAARTELAYLRDSYINLMKRMQKAADTNELKEELKALEKRRDEFGRNYGGAPKRLGEQADVDQQPSRKRSKVSATANTRGKGKGKAVDSRVVAQRHRGLEDDNGVQYDEFDPETYELDSSESLMIETIIYTDANSLPLVQTLQLRHGGGLDLASINFAADVRGIETLHGPALDYDWYCVFERGFRADAFSTRINMLPRGRFLVCRAATILETECPGLQEWINKAYASLVQLAEAYISDGEEDGEDIFPVDISEGMLPFPSSATSSSSVATPPSSSQVAGPSSSQAGPSSRTTPATEAGSSRGSRVTSTAGSHLQNEADRFQGLAKEGRFWRRQEEEDKKFARLPVNESEIIVIEDD